MKFKQIVAVLLATALSIVGIGAYLGMDFETIFNTLVGLGSVPVGVGMIMDNRAEFADATALDTAGTGLVLVGDVMDLSVARNVGNGKPLYCVIQIDTAVTSAGAATCGFVLASDAQAAIAVDGTASVHGQTPLVAKASLIAGYTFIIAVPPEGSVAYERYLGILQNVGVAALTAGKVNAFLTTDISQWKAYSDQF